MIPLRNVAGVPPYSTMGSEKMGMGERLMSFQLSGSAPEIYENTMVPLWFGRWAETLLTSVSLKTGETVLDVACGTGVTTRIARRDVGSGGRVTGLDINAAMLAKARELAADMDIIWMESDVIETGLPDDSFNCRHIPAWLPLLS
jgi:SAM-dependent methyltransferase